MTIDVDVSGPGSAQATIHCKIVDLDENPPPNPVADDRNDSFTPSPVPDRPEKTSAQWTIWDPLVAGILGVAQHRRRQRILV